jgi:hypothetical protein
MDRAYGGLRVEHLPNRGRSSTPLVDDDFGLRLHDRRAVESVGDGCLDAERTQ